MDIVSSFLGGVSRLKVRNVMFWVSKGGSLRCERDGCFGS